MSVRTNIARIGAAVTIAIAGAAIAAPSASAATPAKDQVVKTLKTIKPSLIGQNIFDPAPVVISIPTPPRADVVSTVSVAKATAAAAPTKALNPKPSRIGYTLNDPFGPVISLPTVPRT